MTRTNVCRRVIRVMLGLAVGSALLGASCGTQLRESFKSAGLSFVKDGTREVLDVMFPVGDWLAD